MNSTVLPLMSAADRAAHEAASYIRSNRGPLDHTCDSDPDADELLKRVRNPRSNYTVCPECSGPWSPGHVCSPRVAEALLRLEVEAAYMERDREGLAEYEQYVRAVAA